MYEVLKDLGLCILSLLVKFVAFTANVSARKQPEPYQQVDSTTGVTFIQGFVSIKIKRIIWKLHAVSTGYQRFYSGQTTNKEHEKSSRLK